MRKSSWVLSVSVLGANAVSLTSTGLPVDKVYGVNLGSWLLVEPWMLPQEWLAMGGENCSDCTTCARSEFSLVQKIGQEKADDVFDKHWSSWFNEQDVDFLVEANINTVRIPLGYWIIEALVERETEFYPRGGLKHLKRGLRMLKEKGIHVLLDHHALPGVSARKQMFAGHCTTDVQFYTEKNYNRALVWAAVMTVISHIDPDFGTVFSIEAINEPISDYNSTPGLGDYEKNFVKVVRSVELALGVTCPDADYTKLFSDPNYTDSLASGLPAISTCVDPSIAAILNTTVSILPDVISQLGLSDKQLRLALGSAYVGSPEGLAVDVEINVEKTHSASTSHARAEVPHGSSLERHISRRRAHRRKATSVVLNVDAQRQCLMTSFMSMDWQKNNPANPADAAIGPQLYDKHKYFFFSHEAAPNSEAYLRGYCNLAAPAKLAQLGNTPLILGEWSLAADFNTTPQFYSDWADAQRYVFTSQGSGWIFWSYKIEPGADGVPAWSYRDSFERGYFKKDPSQLNNPDICVPYMNSTSI